MANWLAAERELTASVQNKFDQPTTMDGSLHNPAPAVLEFYGLREEPFGMTPDPAYLYAGRTHGQALEALSFGIKENRGFLALIAEPGMGKTTLLYQLLEELRDSARTVYLFQTQCDSVDFLRYILHDLGVDIQGLSLVAMHSKLNEILFAEMLAGKRFVLVVDEAQNLDDSVLETVRMLSNYENHHTKLLQIVLAGQPALAAKLMQPKLVQLRQRIAVLTRLEPFSAAEVSLYLEHRLEVAGYCGEPLFARDAVELIARHSLGIPRNLNNLCYHSLLAAHARGNKQVTSEAVQQAIARLNIGDLVPNPHPIAASARGASEDDSLPIPQAPASLTYVPRPPIKMPRWPFRAAALAGVLLLGSMLLAMLEHGGAQANIFRVISSPMGEGWLHPATPSQGPGSASYSAEPQDDKAGQVLSVVVRPGQSLEDISLLYAGRFDADLEEEIRRLNPELIDLDHLEVGQLVRIPLPPQTLKKIE